MQVYFASFPKHMVSLRRSQKRHARPLQLILTRGLDQDDDITISIKVCHAMVGIGSISALHQPQEGGSGLIFLTLYQHVTQGE